MQTDTTVYALLQSRAAQAPQAKALLAGAGFELDFASLYRSITDNLARLQSLGIRRNDRVAVLLPQGPGMAIACLTIASGATCAPLNPEAAPTELEYLLQRLRIKLLISSKGFCEQAQLSAINLGIPVLLAADNHDTGIVLSHDGERLDASRLPDYATPNDVALLMHTSGSTARPKIVPLSHANLASSSQHLVKALNLEPEDRCLSMMPQFHIGALVDLLLAPLSAGGSVVVARDMSNRSFSELLAAHTPTWYQGVPTMLQNLASTAASSDTSSIRLVRSVSAPLPPKLQQAIEHAFGAPVIEIYGMTETAGQICSNPLPPGERKPGSVGIAAGPEITVINALGNQAVTGSEGEVAVRGPNVMAGYEVDADDPLNSQSFMGDWLRTGDQGYIDSDGYLFLTGRIKDIINRGGEKISPREIDEVLQAHPAIKDAAAFAIEHDSLGEEVAVAVVVEPGASMSERDIIDYLAPVLAQYKLPRRVFFRTELPRGPGGKLKRSALAGEYGGAPPPSPERFIPPRTPLAKTIAAAWARALEIERVGMHDDFFDLGGHSLGAAMLIEDLEQQLGTRIDAAALYENPTIAGFEAWLIERGIHSSTEPQFRESGLPQQVYRELVQNTAGWRGKRLDTDALIVGRNTMGSRPPLFFCWNGALDALAQHFGVDQPVYCMRDGWGLPSKSEQNTLLIAAHYMREIRRIQPHGPYRLAGFCEGGKIAFEIARLLSGQEPGAIECLILIEQFVPRAYDGKVALLFCERGRMSAYHHYHRPEIGWKKYYRGDTSVCVGNWEHQDLVAGRALQPVLGEVSDVLNKVPGAHHVPLASPSHEAQLLDNDYQCQLDAHLPAMVFAGRKCELTVKLSNTGNMAWKPWQMSGLAVGGRWRRSGRRQRYPGPVAGITRLNTALEPGQSTDLQLSLVTPEKPGLWELHVDAIEEGVTWFGSRTGVDLQRRVFVNASPAGWLTSIRNINTTEKEQ